MPGYPIGEGRLRSFASRRRGVSRRRNACEVKGAHGRNRNRSVEKDPIVVPAEVERRAFLSLDFIAQARPLLYASHVGHELHVVELRTLELGFRLGTLLESVAHH